MFLYGVLSLGLVYLQRGPPPCKLSSLCTRNQSLTARSTILHSTLHELIRLSTLPIIEPSPTSGFHSSYYLGLGFGLAEVTWGIVQGWEQLSLYEDVMTPELDYGLEGGKIEGLGLINEDHYDEDDDDNESAGTIHAVDEVTRQLEEEAELERKVEALERMRGRRGKSRVCCAMLYQHLADRPRSRGSHRHTFPSKHRSGLQAPSSNYDGG